MSNTPIPAPVQPVSNALSGGTWVTGPGGTQTSATTDFDYAETKQWLSIQYTRNPTKTIKANIVTPYRSLAILSGTDDYNVYNTALHYTITVHNSCTKIKQDYTTSAHYQPQKFAINSIKEDKAGFTYGDVSGPNNLYVFGPQGEIVTTQPYISRVIWDAAVHVAYSRTDTGTNHALKLYRSNANIENPAIGPGNWGQGDIGQDYDNYVFNTLTSKEDIYNGRQFPFSKRISQPHYEMVGGSYSTSSEVAFGDNAAGILKLEQFLAQVAVTLWGYPATKYVNLDVINSNGQDFTVDADMLPENHYYSASRHDFT